MTVRPFYLPLIAPPEKDPSDPAGYYQQVNGLATVTAGTSGSGGLDLTVTNPDASHPSQSGVTQPLATVFAPTSGFARYYPAADPLPTPDAQPIGLPTGLTTANIGSLVINVWATDFRYLMRSRATSTPRPNRIVLGRLQKDKVEDALRLVVAKLTPKVLLRSWLDGGGSPITPDDAALRSAFLQRVMSGQAEIFVKAGEPVGRTCFVSDPNDATAALGHMRLGAFFAPGDATQTPQSVPAEDLIDSVLEDTGRSVLFDGHPLLEAINGQVLATFRSFFWIRDNSLKQYIPFATQNVILRRNSGEAKGQTVTDASGQINMANVDLMKSDVIWFELVTTGKTIGSHTFETNLSSLSHKARWYLDAGNVNTNLYRAGYEIHPEYSKFIDELADNEVNEKFGEDRGNAQAGDKEGPKRFLPGIVMVSTQRERLVQMKESEERFKASALANPAKTLTILVEGDSWFHYPFATDIYGHLHTMLMTAKKADVTYNVFPLQHFGDRSDQMFIAGTPATRRQWDYTFDLLAEYPVDLIICSSGGNDFAEPGLSEKDKKRYQDVWLTDLEGNDYFDPYTAKSKLAQAEMDIAKGRIDKSFASLLNNHLWGLFIKNPSAPDQISEQDVYVDLDSHLLGMQIDFGEAVLKEQRKKLEAIGRAVIKGVPERKALPVAAGGDDFDVLMGKVYNLQRYRDRFDSVQQNWKVLLDTAAALHIPVLTQSYSYPLFNEEATSVYGHDLTPRAGPWFTPRFVQAGILDRRVQKICLKALLDHYVWHILEPFKASYQEVDPVSQQPDYRFDYVDVRTLPVAENAKLTEIWRDEMHMRDDGFAAIARKLFDKIVERFPQMFNA